MIRGRALRLHLLSLLLVGSVACSPSCERERPALYLINGDDQDADRFNVLFVGDGFRTTSQLQSFRAAAEQLAAGFLLVPPFADPADRFNFYRIDVIDDTPVLNSCDPDQPCNPQLGDCDEQQAACTIEELVEGGGFVPQLGEEWIAGSGELKRDLDLRLCWSGPQRCNSLGNPQWARRALFEVIGRSGPSFDAVVVIGNTRSVAGGASFRVGGETAIAFVGVPLMQQDGIWSVSPGAIALFAHELAHTIGLYDEYGGSGGNYPPLEPGRNAWKQEALPRSWVELSQTMEPVPWDSLMSCKPWETEICQGVWDEEIRECVTSTPMDCVVVPHDPDFDCTTSLECDQAAGLWEGAYYSNLGYYRSHRYCQMERLGVGFCDACKLALERLLCCYGSGACDLCPI